MEKNTSFLFSTTFDDNFTNDTTILLLCKRLVPMNTDISNHEYTIFDYIKSYLNTLK